MSRSWQNRGTARSGPGNPPVADEGPFFKRPEVKVTGNARGLQVRVELGNFLPPPLA